MKMKKHEVHIMCSDREFPQFIGTTVLGVQEKREMIGMNFNKLRYDADIIPDNSRALKCFALNKCVYYVFCLGKFLRCFVKCITSSGTTGHQTIIAKNIETNCIPYALVGTKYNRVIW